MALLRLDCSGHKATKGQVLVTRETGKVLKERWPPFSLGWEKTGKKTMGRRLSRVLDAEYTAMGGLGSKAWGWYPAAGEQCQTPGQLALAMGRRMPRTSLPGDTFCPWDKAHGT